MRFLRISLGAAAVCAVLSTSPAMAQRLGGQRFSPAGSEDGILGTEGADSRMPMRPYIALWAHYALDPVVLVDENGDERASVVEHLVAADLVASMNVWRGLEFGLGVPVTFLAIGDDAAAAQAGVPAAPGLSLGDITVRAGYRFRLAAHTALALHVPVLLPTTGESNVLGLGFGVKPTLAFMQRFGQVEMLVNASYLVRGAEQELDFDGGDELGARLGFRFALGNTWETAALLDVGMVTAMADPFAPANTPIEGQLGLEHWIVKDVRLTGFVGTGLATGVGAPDFRAGLGVAFGLNPPYRPRPDPSEGDRDGDGVPDERDECPDDPEDPDGFQDADGCPDDDNDQDGVLDWDDGCPTAPETINDISDDDGCPDHIDVEESLITTFEPVYFQTDSDVILERSHPMLREIAAVLKTNPDMHIRVEGHTDASGDDQRNLELSQRRADSVKRFLVENGASSGQVDAEGFGETRPIASNATRAGRAQNRRVEFHIVREED